MEAAEHLGIVSIIPATVAIALAFITRNTVFLWLWPALSVSYLRDKD